MSSDTKFPPGINPRTYLRRHKERGPKRWTYTYEDVATAAEVKVETVKNAVYRGELDMTALRSVAPWIAARMRRKATPETP